MSDSPRGGSGCIVFIVDESSGMQGTLARPAGSPVASMRTKAESVATAINSLLPKLAASNPELPVAIIGYRASEDGQAEVGSRWGGSLAGSTFVGASQLTGAPLRVEQRDRSRDGGVEKVDFPVWYESQPGGKAPQVAAFQLARQLLADWQASAPTDSEGPLVIHISAGASDDGNPVKAVDEIAKMPGWSTKPLVFHAYLGSHDTVPPTFLPANRAYLNVGPMRDLFERSSELPTHLADALKASGVTVLKSARGMAFNARMLELVQLLSTAKTQAERWAGTVLDAPIPVALEPAKVVEPTLSPTPVGSDAGAEALTIMDLVDDEAEPAYGSVSRENPALVVFVADRSVNDPFEAKLDNACAKIQDELGKLVHALHASGGGAVDVAVVSYGADALGATEINATLEGGLQGKSLARSDELHAGAVRIEDSFREEPNGVGGLVRIPLNRIHVVELQAAGGATASPCFQQVREVVNAWSAAHPSAAVPPLVIHLTRGSFDPADIRDAASWLADSGSAAQRPRLYHAVFPEHAADKQEFSAAGDQIPEGPLRTMWEVASPLYGRKSLSEENPRVAADSRGFVVNGNIRPALQPLFNAIAE
jgi:hypothetical protein